MVSLLVCLRDMPLRDSICEEWEWFDRVEDRTLVVEDEYRALEKSSMDDMMLLLLPKLAVSWVGLFGLFGLFLSHASLLRPRTNTH